MVLDMPVLKSDGFSSVICCKYKREFEKYENYMKALQVDLGGFKKRYKQSMAEQTESHSHVCAKRCHVTPGASKKQSCSIPSLSWGVIIPKEPKS